MMSTPAGKVGENTWNSRLAESLRSAGFPSADFELHFPILRGRPRKPDVAFANGGTHLISGKLGKVNEFDAFSSAQEYQQLIGATTSLGEVFGVVYPATSRESFIVHLLANAVHERSVWTASTLEETTEIIRDAVNKRIDVLKHPAEPADASVVRLLRQGVEVLFVSAKRAPESQLKAVFGGADFFDSVLAASVEGLDLRTVLSRAASFLFVNQLLFYSILKRETGAYPDIHPGDMDSPSTIGEKYFALVLEKDYRPIFEIDVASLFAGERNRDGCLRVTRVITELARSVSTHDLAGKVFHEIIPLDFRKIVAAFYTNSAAGDLLASLSVAGPEIKVLDPACGSGTLLVSAYRRKRALASTEGGTEGLHRRFVQEQITGLDVMAFSAHLAAVQLLLQEPLDFTERLRIGTLDSTTVAPGLVVKPFGTSIREAFRQRKIDDFESGKHRIQPHEVVKAGAVAVGREGPESFQLDRVDLVMMNPPFTSSRRMAADYKEALKERFRSSPRYSDAITGNIGYHAYFLCLADMFLETGGRMAVVMPFPTLVGGDFYGLTRFLVSQYTIEYIVCSQGRSAFSENTMFSEVLFVARKGKPKQGEGEHSALVLAKTSPTTWSANDVEAISEAAKACREMGKTVENGLCSVLRFDQHELLPEKKTLTKLVAEFDPAYKGIGAKFDAMVTGNTRILPLGSLVKSKKIRMKVAEVVHGRSGDHPGYSLTRFGGDALVACRSEDRALMKHDRLIFDGVTAKGIRLRDRMSGDTFAVPGGSVIPALRRFAYIDQIDLTDRGDFVVSKEFQGLEKLFKSVLGAKDGAASLRALRKDWAGVIDAGCATVCIPGRIDLSGPGSRLIAVRADTPFFMCSFMWGISGANRSDEKALVVWLNSAPFLYSMLAHLTVTRGSWVKFHGKQILKTPFLDVSQLDPADRRELIAAYDSLRSYRWPSILEQYSSPSNERRDLDQAVLKAIGADKKEAEAMATALYGAIASALATMQRTMGGD